MMATRCGSIDPGIIEYVIRKHGLTVDDVERTLNKESGLLGVSGLSGDFRELRTAEESGHADAHRALLMFAYRVRLGIGQMAAANRRH